MSDEGFREIQLNGKQLVFLFMAATVVSVVIFLCGVLVGRGVRGSEPVDMASAAVAPDPGPLSSSPSGASSEPGPTGSAAGAEVTAPAEELSYADRLLKDTAPPENLKDTPSVSAQPPPPPPAPAPKPAAPRVKEPVAVKPAEAPREAAPTPPRPTSVEASAGAATLPAGAAAADPSGPGFAVQVAAYRDRQEADSLAKQLIAKGYPAFVMDPVKGAPTAMFRVRVGKYKTLKDAEAVSTRLQAAEQFKPWIAR